MRDEFDDRLYQAYRHQLGDDIDRLFRAIAYAFQRLQARLYEAPWSPGPESEGKQKPGGGFTTL